MKNILVLALVISISTFSFAQNPNMSRTMPQGQMPTGRFYGKIVDNANKSIEAASVTLIQNKFDTATKKQIEVITGGMLTTKTGDFSIENVALFGKYKLRISGIGFQAVEQSVAFNMPNRDAMSNGDMSAMMGALEKDLGNIKLQIDEKVLGGVTVTTNRPGLTMGIDRKIFNVDKNITSTGGTAVDIMKNVPSVDVDIDGNVTLRNAAPQIFVDGRPTTLTLDQIPADAIESVEIITNPSAKYDASGGTAGILNIVMKKNKRAGYSGNLRTSIDSRGRVGFGGDANIRQNKINIFASGNFFQPKSISTGVTNRTNFGANDSTYNTLQNDNSTGMGNFRFGRAGFDYFLDIRNTISVNGMLMRGNMGSNASSDIFVDSLLRKTPYGSELQKRMSNSNNIFKRSGFQVSYKHNFPKSGHEWSADVTYNDGRGISNSDIKTDYYRMPGQRYNRTYRQTQNGSNNNENLVIQTDYVNPLSDKSKIEFGARATRRTINSEINITIANKINNTSYNSIDNVYAAYANFANRINNFGYQLGLRMESSDYEGVLPTKNQKFNIEFPISFFPSMFLSNKFSENDELQFNYSRRINRPNFFQLFPFTDYSDSLNISHGNPNLKPEFTNSLELSYSKTLKNRDNILFSAYFKNTNNLITPFQTLEYDTLLKKEIIANTYANANKSYVTGLELTTRNKITKWWDLTSNFNLFTARIEIQNQPTPDQFPSYFIKLNNTFKLPSNFTVQLSGDYRSKVISSPGGRGSGGGDRMHGGGGGMFGGGVNSASQGYIRPNYGVDAAIKYEFLKNKAASISLNVNDIFKTKVSDIHSETSFFVQDLKRRRDPQVFRLNFGWRFGKFDASLFKRKNMRAEGNVDMNMGQ